MHPLEHAIEGVLNSEVDLWTVAQENKSHAVGPMLDILARAAMDDYLDESEDYVSPLRARELKSRRRILDVLIEETGGKALLEDLNLGRGWNTDHMGSYDAVTKIGDSAYRHWVFHSEHGKSNRAILRMIRKSDEFQQKKEQCDNKVRIFVMSEIEKRLGISLDDL